MKKIVSFCLAVVLLLGAVGCGETVAQMDMQDLYGKLGGAVAMPEMLELDAGLMLDYCGIRAEYVTQALVVICADSLRTDELWLLEAKDADSAKKLVSLAEKRLEKKGEESITYSPEQYAVVEKAQLLQLGNYVILLVSPDAAAMAQVVNEAAGK
jgi:hypothetical protein